MLEGWTHRGRVRATVALAAAAVVGVTAFVSSVSASPQSPQRRTATMAALAAQAVRAHSAAVAPTGKVFGGFTPAGPNSTGGWPTVAVLSRNGKHFSVLGIGLDMKCSPSGATFSLNDDWDMSSFRLDKHGNISEDYGIPSKGSLLGGTDLWSIHFDRKHQTITGSWRLQLNYTIPNQAAPDQCDSGKVSFKLAQ